MLKVDFRGATEIRMGSPFNVCRIELTGDWVPELPPADWQDVAVRRDDGEAVALVRWDVGGNVPGFRLVVVDARARRVVTSRRLPGCCQRLAWCGRTRLEWHAFPDLHGTWRIPPVARAKAVAVPGRRA